MDAMRTFIPAIIIPRIWMYNLTHFVYGFNIALIYNFIAIVRCPIKIL